MLAYDSENLLKDLLVSIGSGERHLEVLRKRLCNIKDFAPHSAF
jgi:hypothetical protein